MPPNDAYHHLGRLPCRSNTCVHLVGYLTAAWRPASPWEILPRYVQVNYLSSRADLEAVKLA